MSSENKELVRRLIQEVWSDGNLEAVDELLTADCVRVEPNEETAFRGQQAFKERVKFFRGGFPDLTVEIDDIVAEGNKVGIRWTARGTHKGALGDVPASNNYFETPGCGILQIRDGKIFEEIESWDTLGFMQQLGVVPKDLETPA